MISFFNPNPPLGFGSNDSKRMRCEAEGAFLQRVYRDVHEQKNAPTTKQIAAMNIATGSAPIAESGFKGRMRLPAFNQMEYHPGI